MNSDFGVELLHRHWAAFVDLGYLSVDIIPSISTYWTTGIDSYSICLSNQLSCLKKPSSA